MNGHVGSLRLLLAAGADPTKANVRLGPRTPQRSLRQRSLRQRSLRHRFVIARRLQHTGGRVAVLLILVVCCTPCCRPRRNARALVLRVPFAQNKGITPFDAAEHFKHAECAILLKEYSSM